MARAALMLVSLAAVVLGYNTRWDSIDLDKLLKNDKIVDAHVACLEDQGVCTAEGSELKHVLPDALMTGCSNCTESQRVGAHKVIEFLCRKRPQVFRRLRLRYDPTGTYEKQYAHQFKACTAPNL